MKDANPNSTAVHLSNATLDRLPSEISTPSYDRSQLTPGIVHIGLGNFHRAHQAWYLHRLMEQGLALDWAIIGAGVRKSDQAMRERLLAQDCLTTLIELDPEGTSVEVIGPMIDFLPVEETNASLIRAMSDPAIRIVSLTVTEGGYFLDPQGNFDADHPDIQHDVANPNAPRTAFGAMVAALKARRAAGVLPFTGQCCDNLQDNGAVLRQTVVGLAKLIDADLAEWIDSQSSFPNAMVDCIVPATGETERNLALDHGIDDAAPVTHENFRQWVIEDAFCNGRPEWERVGATLTKDVHPYESMKIRILNAGHQILANAGEILGLETIGDCMADDDLLAFFRNVQSNEIRPHVDPVPHMTAADYLSLIEARFANPLIKDTTRRVAFDGSSRHAGFVLPIIKDALDQGAPIAGLAMVEALWCHMCAGKRDDASDIEPNDPQWGNLHQTALQARRDPLAWLNQTAIYGDNFASTGFAETFCEALELIQTEGVRRALQWSVE